MLDQVRTFYRRRIEIPVDSTGLVLDVGSGDRPHWRADVLVDRHPGEDMAGQRSGGRTARVTRPLFDADAAAMPFTDGVFDFVVCSHVLEHVVDPGAVIDEMCRVGRAGYIEVPDVAMAKISDFPSHLWWCRMDGDTLVFTAKRQPFFDADIDDLISRSAIAGRLDRLFGSVLEHCIVAVHWRGSMRYRVEGSPSEEMITATRESTGRHHTSHVAVGRALNGAFALGLRHKRRCDPVRYDDIVEPALRRGSDEVLVPRIYHAHDAAAAPDRAHERQ